MLGFSVIMFKVLASIQIVTCLPTIPVGFSYTKFSGPVSGPEKEIVIYDPQDYGHPHVDYIAKPDYHFSYGVDDPLSKVQQSRKERRYGDVVQGEYSFVEPNGFVRTVKYVADDVNGFQAEVVTQGHPDSEIHHHVPAVIPVHEEPPVYDESPVTSEPSPSTPSHSPVRESIVVHEEESNDSTYSSEGSEEDEESHGHHHALKDDDGSSGSDESEDSSY